LVISNSESNKIHKKLTKWRSNDLSFSLLSVPRRKKLKSIKPTTEATASQLALASSAEDFIDAKLDDFEAHLGLLSFNH
jgi:hypothetical protein